MDHNSLYVWRSCTKLFCYFFSNVLWLESIKIINMYIRIHHAMYMTKLEMDISFFPYWSSWTVTYWYKKLNTWINVLPPASCLVFWNIKLHFYKTLLKELRIVIIWWKIHWCLMIKCKPQNLKIHMKLLWLREAFVND